MDISRIFAENKDSSTLIGSQLALMNGDFCGHSRFVLWHENLTTFVSSTLGLLPNLNPGGGGGGFTLIHSKSWP